MMLGLCIGVATWALFLIGHLTTMQMAATAKRARIDRSLFVGGFIAIPAVVGVAMAIATDSTWTQGGWLGGTLWATLVYAAFFTLYFPPYYVIAASLSVGTVVVLARERDASLPVAVLYKRFASRALVAERLDVMVLNGLLVKRGDEYRLTPRGLFIARAFAALKRLWCLGAGG